MTFRDCFKLRLLFVLALGVYSAALLSIEWNTSQSHVRHYFTDITGPVPFYAVNTSLSVYLLLATSIIFAVHVRFLHSRDSSHAIFFPCSQCLLFGWLAMDDRFLIHERVSFRLGVADHYILLILAMVQLYLLVRYSGEWFACKRARYCFAAAAVLFSAMMFLDVVAPHEMVMRLSMEDLAKTWANLFLFLFGWELLMRRFHEAAQSGDTPRATQIGSPQVQMACGDETSNV